MSFEQFIHRIRKMNQTMELPCNSTPTDLGDKRIQEFVLTMVMEIAEASDIIREGDPTKRLVMMADWLGDLIVYVASEAQRWGIPTIPVLSAIMDSQESKLVDGRPVPGDAPGKFGKGPNYQPPEPRILAIIEEWSAQWKEPCDQELHPEIAGTGLTWTVVTPNGNHEVNSKSFGEKLQEAAKKQAEDDGVNYERCRSIISDQIKSICCPKCQTPSNDEAVWRSIKHGEKVHCPACGASGVTGYNQFTRSIQWMFYDA